MLEQKAGDGKIQYSGLATWAAFRVPRGHRLHMCLETLMGRVVARLGPAHRFRFLHAPINLAMPEAFAERTQRRGEEDASLLRAATELGLNVFATSPFLAGALLELPLSSVLLRASYQGPKTLNLLRSLPHASLKTVVMGARRNRHVKTNLNVAFSEKLEPAALQEMLLTATPRRQLPEEPLPEYK